MELWWKKKSDVIICFDMDFIFHTGRDVEKCSTSSCLAFCILACLTATSPACLAIHLFRLADDQSGCAPLALAEVN